MLRLLSENPELSQRDLAAEVGISLGAMHYCLRALVDKGLIKLARFRAAQDKRRYAYVLTPRGFSEKAALTRRFLAFKLEEYKALEAEIRALKAEMREETGRDRPVPSGE